MSDARRSAIEARLGGGIWACPTCGRPQESLAGSAVRALRKSRGLSQHQLARSAGMPQSLVSNIETGKACLTYGRAEKLLIAMSIGLPA
jgi:DNA-binding transcriptional regulator YiaG